MEIIMTRFWQRACSFVLICCLVGCSSMKPVAQGEGLPQQMAALQPPLIAKDIVTVAFKNGDRRTYLVASVSDDAFFGSPEGTNTNERVAYADLASVERKEVDTGRSVGVAVIFVVAITALSFAAFKTIFVK
jgi:hypothetical protein